MCLYHIVQNISLILTFEMLRIHEGLKLCSVYLLQIISPSFSPSCSSPQLFISDPELMMDCEADNT